jgi:hypothetical protein
MATTIGDNLDFIFSYYFYGTNDSILILKCHTAFQKIKAQDTGRTDIHTNSEMSYSITTAMMPLCLRHCVVEGGQLGNGSSCEGIKENPEFLNYLSIFNGDSIC